MIYFYNLQHSDKGNIAGTIHYYPLDPIFGLGKTEAELRRDGVLVGDDFLDLPAKDGYIVQYVCDIAKQTVTPTYVELPPEQPAPTTPSDTDELLTRLREAVSRIEAAQAAQPVDSSADIDAILDIVEGRAE